MGKGTVFVSNATGYIAIHISKELITRGYQVVGFVRTRSKGKIFKRKLGAEKFSYEIVADISEGGCFDEALKKHPEVSVFLHAASPVTVNFDDLEKVLLIPAVNRTKNALLAIKEYGINIKQVVVTSSLATMFNPLKKNDVGMFLTESSWNTMSPENARQDPFLGYLFSKILAEKAV